jgi:tetratricopeptide (TPR) repeat protein
MGQLCLNGQWTDGVLTWKRAAALEDSSTEADRLLALYEEGNLRAQGGDLPKALALFQRGMSAFLAIDKPDAHHRVAEAALLWGLGTATDRAERGEGGWRTLLQIMAPGGQRQQLPLGLAINWSHSATLAGYRHDKYVEVCALLDALQRLGWGDELQGSTEASEAVRERYLMLSPFRARSFEGLMQEERFEEAAQVAGRALETQRQCQPQDEQALQLWLSLQAAAARREPRFSLEGGQEEDPDEAESEMPAIRVMWDGKGKLQWRLGVMPEDPNSSALARLYTEAAQNADAGNATAALKLYERGLAAWDDLKHPRSCDAVVRAMMLWGKATLQESLSEDGSPHAWETLMKLAEPGKGNALPLPLLLSWTQSSVIVATGLRRWPQVQALLIFLMEMAMHPKLGRHDEELSQELIQRFLFLLEGAYASIEDDPVLAAEWVRSLQRKVEPPGLILLPLRDLLFHALTAAKRHHEAEAVATEVLVWARQEGEQETARDWDVKARSAKKATLAT